MSERFYTNVQLYGNQVLVREVDGGKRIKYKDDFSPTLYLKTKKKTEYTTLNGDYVEPIQPGTIKDCRNFYSKYENVDGFEIYGNERFLYQYISEQYPEDEIKFDINKIKLISLDIETASENSFPDVETCLEEILAITIQDYSTKQIITWGVKPYHNTRKDVTYHYCPTEYELLSHFLAYWMSDVPDVVTGWNCIPIESNIWKSDKICKLSDICIDDILYDSKVETIYPKSFKTAITQKLANGSKVVSSRDHIFPYVLCPGKKYTKLTDGHKTHSYHKDMSVEESMKSDDEKFIFVPLRKNTNLDNPDYTYEQCYLLGLIYTDGTLKDKNNLSYGFTVYQSDLEFLSELKADFSINNKIVGPYKNCYQLGVRKDILGDMSPIYNGNKKKINIKLLSTFSEKQFYIFLSGLLDGDGYVSSNTISLCNYNNDLLDLYELCLWNGIFATLNKYQTSLHFIDINYSMLKLRKTKRWDRMTIAAPLKRNSSEQASKIRFKKIDGGYLVRVVDYYESEKTEMLDIKTNTGYFIASGVRTHNCNLYDIPYICKRMSRVLGEKVMVGLSPWNLVSENEVVINGRKHTTFEIKGVSQLDYLDLYKKFTYKSQESYRLDYIAEVELGQKKLDHSEYDTFKEFYQTDWQKFIDYNILDVELVDRLEDKMKLIELVLTMAYDAKVNYDDVFYQVRLWDTIIYNYLKKRNIVVPPKIQSSKDDKYAGAYVKEPIPGMYEWVVSLDLDSLYPHLIMEFNIGPDTLVEQKHPTVNVEKILNQELDFSDYKDFVICPNGSMYRRDIRGFLPEIMEKLYNERKLYKKKMIEAKKEYEKTPTKKIEKEIARCNNIQLARKVNLNSCYGSLGNPYFKYYKLENAEAITLSGQVAIRWIENKVNQYLNKILKTENIDFTLASDTDSVVSDTMIYINSDKIKICDLYDLICNDENLIHKRDEYDFIHNVSDMNLFTKSYDGIRLVEDKILHIMKHKVKKKLYKITVNEKNIILTEDHSLIVERNGKLISVKPYEVLEKDIFINISDTGQCLKTVYKNETHQKNKNS